MKNVPYLFYSNLSFHISTKGVCLFKSGNSARNNEDDDVSSNSEDKPEFFEVTKVKR